MKKIIFIHFLSFVSIGLLSAQEQKFNSAIQMTKTELLSLKDIKQLLSFADYNKDHGYYLVRHFTLSGSTTETSDKGIVIVSFSESVDGGTLTEKQRSLIEKYSKEGMVFTFEEISLMETGEPGTPYNPAHEAYFTRPTILITIK